MAPAGTTPPSAGKLQPAWHAPLMQTSGALQPAPHEGKHWPAKHVPPSQTMPAQLPPTQPPSTHAWFGPQTRPSHVCEMHVSPMHAKP